METAKSLLYAHNRASYQKNRLAARLGQAVRCVLLISTVCSLATYISPELLAQMVRVDLWQPEQGITYVRQISDKEQQVDALQAIAPYLPTEQQSKVLQEALTITQEIEEEDSRSSALADISSGCGRDQIEVVFAILDTIAHERRRVAMPILAELSKALVEIGGTKAVRETVRAIVDVGRWWP